jgi:putative addiction module component (TIGR02574 family)
MNSPSIDPDALNRLSLAERLHIVEELWDSIAEEAPEEALPITPKLAAEFHPRLAEYRADPESAISWEEIRQRILARTK